MYIKYNFYEIFYPEKNIDLHLRKKSCPTNKWPVHKLKMKFSRGYFIKLNINELY